MGYKSWQSPWSKNNIKANKRQPRDEGMVSALKTQQEILDDAFKMMVQQMNQAAAPVGIAASATTITIGQPIYSFSGLTFNPNQNSEPMNYTDMEGTELKIGDEIDISYEHFSRGSRSTRLQNVPADNFDPNTNTITGKIVSFHPENGDKYLYVEFWINGDFETGCSQCNFRDPNSRKYDHFMARVAKKKVRKPKNVKLALEHFDKLVIAEDDKKEIIAVLKQHEKQAKLFQYTS